MLQVQPVFKNKGEFEELAKDYNVGFEALELSFANITKEKRDWYESCGLVTSYHGAFMNVNPGCGDDRIRDLSRLECKESIENAIKCGAKNVVFHSTCEAFIRGGYMEYWSSLCADFYNSLANEYKINIYIENSMDVDPEPIKLLISKTNNSLVKACLDVGHVNYSRTPIEKWVDVLGDSIGYLHLSDNKGLFDDHMQLGTGNIDWGKTSKLLSYLGKDIPMTLEVGDIEQIKSSIDFIKGNHYFGL